MPRGNRTATPTTCNASDLLNTIYHFVHTNPEWYENDEMVTRMAMAYFMFTRDTSPDMVTDEEYEFVMGIHTTLTEIRNG